jgi:hypothetical protein
VDQEKIDEEDLFQQEENMAYAMEEEDRQNEEYARQVSTSFSDEVL